MDTEAVGNVFNTMLSNPGEMTFWMVIVTAFGFGTCCMGLQKGVERITKVMMVCLLTIMVVLCIKSCTLPGAIEGIKFYLLPDFGRLKENGLLSGIYAAMGQAFFTLSLGIGAMAIFGSYIDKGRSLMGESIQIGDSGYFRSSDGRFDHLPCMLCLQCKSYSGCWSCICHSAKHVQPDDGRTLLGRTVLYLYDLCSSFHHHCRI